MDLGALATEHGHDLTILVGDLHIVDAVAAAQGLFDANAGQHIAKLAGTQKFNAAAGSHGIPVVAVAGESKGRIGQSEDEATVTDPVTVEVQLFDFHLHHGATRFAGQQRHAHGVLGGHVYREHGLAHLAGDVLWGHLHSPLNCGVRFCRKAVTPSM